MACQVLRYSWESNLRMSDEKVMLRMMMIITVFIIARINCAVAESQVIFAASQLFF